MRVPKAHALGLVGGLVLAGGVLFAQSQTPGWRRADEPAPAPATDPSTPVATPEQVQAQAQAPPPQNQAGAFDQNQNGVPAAAPPPANAGLPPHLTIPAGRFINVRVDQILSTNRNHTGDFFSATLIDPIVVDGIVVAERGQHVAGQVTESEKGHGLSPIARLGLQITQLTAVDGQQLPVHTQLISRNGPSTAGRNAGIIAGTTGVGAAVGAAAAWGTGAAVGAGAGFMLGIAGVLLGHGAPAVVYPETPLTFRMEQAADVDTQRAPQAFQPVNPSQYQQPQLQTGPAGPAPAPGAYPPGAYPPGAYAPAPYSSPYAYGYGYGPYAYAPYPYYYPYYPYPYYPYYWGPGFGVVIGPGFYGRGFYGGFRGGFRR